MIVRVNLLLDRNVLDGVGTRYPCSPCAEERESASLLLLSTRVRSFPSTTPFHHRPPIMTHYLDVDIKVGVETGSK